MRNHHTSDTTVCTLGVHMACELAKTAGLCVHVVARGQVLVYMTHELDNDTGDLRPCHKESVPLDVDLALRRVGFELCDWFGVEHYALWFARRRM
jgi:hypothetical protein